VNTELNTGEYRTNYRWIQN